ncbi:MAG: hypothetical protein DRI34_08225 [Deltaproteobacteria bacterium]|nr:MAG: hypothetical protein DRI34_08225 [Deltaproteobacteria bacterium]
MHWSFLATALILLLPACSSQTPDVPVAFTPRDPPPQLVEQILARERQLVAGYQPNEQLRPLVEAFSRFNVLAADRKTPRQKLEQSYEHLRILADKALQQAGREEFHKLVLYLLERFDRALERFTKQADAASIEAWQAGRQQFSGPLQQAYQELLASGSDFLPTALQAGLLRPGGQGLSFAPAGRFFIRLAFKVRFASLLTDLGHALDWLLDPRERQWYAIWVAERSRSASPARKLQAVQRLSQLDPHYPTITARGIIHFQAGRYDAAQADFEEVLRKNPGDKKLQSWLRQARQAAKRQQSAGKSSRTRQP